MRTLDIKSVETLEAGKTIQIPERHSFHMMPTKDGATAVVFQENVRHEPLPVTDEEGEKVDSEFVEKWQLRPGSFWLHPSEGLKQKTYAKETYFETETSKKISKIFQSFVDNVEISRHFKKLKRSYLIHSEPGYGKSALIRHFCRQIQDYPGLCIIHTDGTIDFGILTHMFNAEYHEDLRMVVLIIEDMGTKDHARNLNMYNSSCLNFLDGHPGLFRVPTMIFATTNYAKELGAQFTNRPGRFNRIIKCDLPSDEEVFSLVERYIGCPLSCEEKEAFAGKNLTPDHCVEAVLRSKIEGMTMSEAVAEILSEREGMMRWE